jgi:cysteinyl-tRNA synthetase
MDEMADFIDGLLQQGVAYRTEDGSYYFRITKFPEYGKLSKKDLAHIEDGARVDFRPLRQRRGSRLRPLEGSQTRRGILGHQDRAPAAPGWHIECSTMSMKYLGDTFRHPRWRRRSHLPSS